VDVSKPGDTQTKDTPTIDAPDRTVAEMLDAMPAQTIADRDSLCASLAKLGEPGVAEVCVLLVPPGTGDDTAARFLLNGAAKYAARPGAETEREVFSSAIVTALGTTDDVENKAFLVRQLEVAGGDEAVDALAGLLSDEALGEPAAQVLRVIGTKKATKALVKALPDLAGLNRVAVTKALAELGDDRSMKLYTQDAASDDVLLKSAALYALANIGNPESADILAKAAATGDTQATSWYLLYARRLGEKYPEKGAAICRDLAANRTEPNVQSAALASLAEIEGN
jgi:HEAT repeat protein